MLSELQAIAEVLSKRLRRAVAIDDPALRLLVHTAHQGGHVDQVRLDAILAKQTLGPAREHLLAQGITAATGAVRVSGREDLAMLPRVCAPLRHQNELLGFLWLMDADGQLTAEDLQATEDAAKAGGAVMYQERLLGDIQRGRERETVRDLLTEDDAVRRHAADTLVQSAPVLGNSPVVAMVVRIVSGQQPGEPQPVLESALLHAVRQLPPYSGVHLARVDHGVLLAASGRAGLTDSRLEELAAQVRVECSSALGPDARVLIGVGAPVAELVDAVTSYWQARRTIDVATVVPTLGPVAWWSRLGVYSLLVQLGLDAVPVATLPPSLAKLFELDKSGNLAETLEIYLDHITDPAAAVAALHIHRTTLYYRLSRISELTGMDLKDGGERLAVHLGLKLVRLVGKD